MKKHALSILVLVTAVFGAFILGLFLGRSSHRGSVTVAVPPALQTEPVLTQPATVPTQAETVYPIDLNTATLEDLKALPGIGEVLAQRILSYREEYGPFRSVDELLMIEDIGEKRLEAILAYITIGG